MSGMDEGKGMGVVEAVGGNSPKPGSKTGVNSRFCGLTAVHLIALAMAFAQTSGVQAQTTLQAQVTGFVRQFEAKAVVAGIPASTYKALTKDLRPDPRIPSRVAGQPEFTTPMWDYLDKRVSASRVKRGRAAFSRNADLFARIGRQFGVDPYILASIWGMETDYGAVLGNKRLIGPVLPSLATLVVQDRGRRAADEDAFLAALNLIVEQGWTADRLVGSWAGAIGHTQVLVTGLLAHGRDGDGDGVIDPHRSLADALATTAAYLRALGYQPGLDWGYEVTLPQGFDYLLADREQLHPLRFFAQRGVKRVAGRAFSRLDVQVFLYLPAGRNGPKFLMTENYLALKGYNFSDSYALSVAHLTDRLKGSGPFVQSWPRSAKFLNLGQRRQFQQWLQELGYYAGDVDGRIGPVTQRALQLFQAKNGLVADGFVDASAYDMLQNAAKR